MELKLEGVIATSAPEHEDGIRLFGPDLNNPTRRNQRRVGLLRSGPPPPGRA